MTTLLGKYWIPVVVVCTMLFVFARTAEIGTTSNAMPATASVRSNASRGTTVRTPSEISAAQVNNVTLQITRDIQLQLSRRQQREMHRISEESQLRLAALQAERETVARFETQAAMDREQQKTNQSMAVSADTTNAQSMVGTGTIEITYAGDQSRRKVIDDGSGITVTIVGDAPEPLPMGISYGHSSTPSDVT